MLGKMTNELYENFIVVYWYKNTIFSKIKNLKKRKVITDNIFIEKLIKTIFYFYCVF